MGVYCTLMMISWIPYSIGFMTLSDRLHQKNPKRPRFPQLSNCSRADPPELSTPLSAILPNIGAYIITNTILGVPYYYYYGIMGPKTLF